ncbi:VaFE repeat-containing surface-anchored protein [Corynebacterium sp. A21]|uniref:VaFE repeat-containing surface-anchored protein n=1 Tax=Corynebacterium sp. A21 TaxID=3457318 RepID=UPI003FD390C0
MPILVITAVIALILALLPVGASQAGAEESNIVATEGIGERGSEVGDEGSELGGAEGESAGDGESGNVFARFLNVLLSPFQTDEGRDINDHVRITNLSVVNSKSPNDDIHVGDSVLVQGEFVFEDLGREGALSGDYFDLPVPGLLRWDDIPFDLLGPNKTSWGECSRRVGTEDFRCVLNEEIEGLMGIAGGWEGAAFAAHEGQLFEGSIVLPSGEVSLGIAKTGQINTGPAVFSGSMGLETEFDAYSTITWKVIVDGEDLKDLSEDLVLFDEFDRADVSKEQKICELPEGASLEDRLNLDLLYPIQPVITERDGGIEFRFSHPDTSKGFGNRRLDLRFTLCTSSGDMDPVGTKYDNHVLATSFMGDESVQAESEFSFTQNQQNSGYIEGALSGTFSLQKQISVDSVFIPEDTVFAVQYEEFAPGVDPATGEAASTGTLSVLADGTPVSGENAREEGWTIRLTEPTFPEIPGIEFGDPVFAADPDAEESHVEVLDGGKTALVRILPRANVLVTLTNTARSTAEPRIGTVAKVTGAEKLPVIGGQVVDTVNYVDLQPNAEYQLSGELIHVDAGGTPTPTGIEATSSFTTGEAAEGENVVSGSTTVTFDITAAAAAKYADEKLVVYETLRDTEGNTVAEHKDPADVAQTFEVENFLPDIGTYANVTGARMLPVTGGQVVDTVNYVDLQPDTEYRIKGELVHVEGEGQPMPTGIEGTGTFTTGAAPEGRFTVAGSTTVTFQISEAEANKYAGEKLVVYETLLDTENNLIAEHKDPNDEAQTFEVEDFQPEIGTTAAVTGSETKTLLVTGGEVVDTITYRDLQPNTEYLLTGELIHVDGKPMPTGIKTTGTFTTGEASEVRLTVDGSTTVTFEISEAEAHRYAGEKLVVYESLHDTEGNLVAEHKDPDDEAQSFEVGEFEPWIGTTATVTDSEDNILPLSGGEVVDTVEYHNLKPDTEYRLEGTIVQVSADERVIPTGITATGTFTTTETHGHAEVIFTITAAQAAEYAGEKLVVYETLFDATGNKVAEHRDPEDLAQTFRIFHEEEEEPQPKIGTTVEVPGSEAKELPITGGQIVDTVEYEQLQPNTEYHLEGEIKHVTAAGTVNSTSIFAEATFITPDAPAGQAWVSGSTTVTFEVPAAIARKFRGEKLVVFETLFDINGNLVAEHHDPEDPKQTFTVEEPDTPPTPPTLTTTTTPPVPSTRTTPPTPPVQTTPQNPPAPPVTIIKAVEGPKSAEIEASGAEFQVRASWTDPDGKNQTKDIILKPGIPGELIGLPVNTEITLNEIGARPKVANIHWADVVWSGTGVEDESGQSTSATILIEPGNTPVEIGLLNKTSSRSLIIIPLPIPPRELVPPTPETPPAPEVSTTPETPEAPVTQEFASGVLAAEPVKPVPPAPKKSLANTGANVALLSTIALILLAVGAGIVLRGPKREN